MKKERGISLSLFLFYKLAGSILRYVTFLSLNKKVTKEIS